MKNKLLFSLIFIANISFAQLENNTWYFSPTTKGIVFDFVTNTPTVATCHTALSDLHGCGIASNPATGAVMFYTDAQSVYDVGNFQMPNGSGLSGGSSCAEKGMIIQVPDSCYKYYVISNDANSPTMGSLYYNIVDMKLPGNGSLSIPRGDVEVATKNTVFMDSSTECYTVVPNNIGHNYWLIAPVNGTSNINVYSITSSGIVFANRFNTGHVFNSSMSIKYSKNAGKVAYTSVVENDPALLMNFNSVTGVLSATSVITGTPVGSCTNIYNGWHDVEFSPDGTKLYLSKYRMFSPASAGRIYQYDLSAPSTPVTVVFDNAASTDIYKTITGFQTGPDGKIYFIYFNTITSDDRTIGAINSPNLAGTTCNINPSALDLGVAQGTNARFSKPAFFNKDIYVNNVPCAPISHEGINEYNTPSDFTIYPNPTSTIVTISINNPSPKSIITITNIIGEIIYKEDISMKNNYSIDLSKQSKGIYFVTLQSDKGRSTKKIVVE